MLDNIRVVAHPLFLTSNNNDAFLQSSSSYQSLLHSLFQLCVVIAKLQFPPTAPILLWKRIVSPLFHCLSQLESSMNTSLHYLCIEFMHLLINIMHLHSTALNKFIYESKNYFLLLRLLSVHHLPIRVLTLKALACFNHFLTKNNRNSNSSSNPGNNTIIAITATQRLLLLQSDLALNITSI